MDKKNSYYWARGIRVCKRWAKYENFVADMGERPPGHTLDRINNNKGYSPANCRWATYSFQVSNRRPYGKSPYRGVCWTERDKTWRAVVTHAGKQYYAGTFSTEKEAYKAYLKKRKEVVQ